jgi:putative DNA primase/helicase
MLLDPVLPAAGLMMLHAKRGTAKTFLALAMGLAAGAPVLRWSAPRARRVLYVDGEMALVDLKARIAALRVGMGAAVSNDYFRVLAADHSAIPLATALGEDAPDVSSPA